MEGDSGQGGHQKKGFNLEEAKGTYEGDGMRITAQKTLGNETREPKFRAALWIAQNAQIQPPADSDPDSGKAVMERICHIHWDKSHFSQQGSEAAERLLDLKMEDINGFMVHCVKHEALVLERMRFEQRAWVKKLKDEYPNLVNDRIRFNHAQLLALAKIMVEIGAVPLTNRELIELEAFIIERAHERQTAIEFDHAMVVEFWELYDHLCSAAQAGEAAVNWHGDDKNKIAVNLKQMEALAGYFNLRMPVLTDLRPLLQTSKRHKYIKHNHSVRHPDKKGKQDETKKCYIFEKGV